MPFPRLVAGYPRPISYMVMGPLAPQAPGGGVSESPHQQCRVSESNGDRQLEKGNQITMSLHEEYFALLLPLLIFGNKMYQSQLCFGDNSKLKYWFDLKLYGFSMIINLLRVKDKKQISYD